MNPSLTDYDFAYTYGPDDDRVNDFYLPALSRSIHYDRTAGYFTSAALAMAATGIVRLIQNGGKMRLLVGAQLNADDVEAIRAGYDLRDQVATATLRVFQEPENEIIRDRLAALAWMIATGTLDIRVVLHVDENRVPTVGTAFDPYFHVKTGIFVDAFGNELMFTGSVNETVQAWSQNYEEFNVFRSWVAGQERFIADRKLSIERLWLDQQKEWMALEIPTAAREALLRYTPATAPTIEPLEKEAARLRRIAEALRRPADRSLLNQFRFVRDAPYLIGATRLAEATSNVQPWPHQERVSQSVVRTHAHRYLIADEVGLGKTIEAGLIVRQLLLSGIARRILILAPKAVLRQWQGELYEKFALNVPIYTGSTFEDYHEVVTTPTTPNPWDNITIALASSHLMKRQDRQNSLLETHPWDLVLVDEAHHARRKDFLDKSTYRPNRLLELLNALQQRTDGLLLMTATPMQVDPIEVWDLINLLGLSGEWATSGERFLRFFSELRKLPEQRDWDYIFRLVNDETNLGGRDPSWVKQNKMRLSAVQWEQFEKLLKSDNPSRAFRTLEPVVQKVAADFARHHTPLRRLIYRHTRTTLRAYKEQGLLKENVPTRKPELMWIPMREEEMELYDRVEEYISNFYQKYEQVRRGLGFIMTVYRRRLTSSFYAVHASLERRLAFLQDQNRGSVETSFDEDDQNELELDDWNAAEVSNVNYREEIDFLNTFLQELHNIVGSDSKISHLIAALNDIFLWRDTVIIFTQYTDTMDFLRERLREQYGSAIACYSGRGGEVWDPALGKWLRESKERVKNEFRKGETIRILLCTESASEGLNLQTCGVLINYDMPWNPMRVEQRIGRIDRIRQVHEQVWIHNYFYEDTVEARIYRALENRIHWFEDVVGTLQPILASVGKLIESAVLADRTTRNTLINQEIQRLTTALSNQDDALDIDAYASVSNSETAQPAPVSLPELAQILPVMPALRDAFQPHPTIATAYRLRWRGTDHDVTFHAPAFDDHPNSLQLLTYGNPLFDELVQSVTLPTTPDSGKVLRLETSASLPRVAYFTLENGSPRPLNTLTEITDCLNHSSDANWTNPLLAAAREQFITSVRAEIGRLETSRSTHIELRRATLLATLRELLIRAAYIELALGRQGNLFAEQGYPIGFDNQAVYGLKRYNFPFATALSLLGGQSFDLVPTDHFFTSLDDKNERQLKAQFEGIREELARTVREAAQLRKRSLEAESEIEINQSWLA